MNIRVICVIRVLLISCLLSAVPDQEKKVFKHVYGVLISLRTTNVLLVILIGFHIVGAMVMPNASSFDTINRMALFTWLNQVSFQDSWWIIGTIFVLGLLVINSVLCSIDSVLRKKEGRTPLLTISPQIIHAGFCFMLLAHMVSGFGASHQEAVLHEGYRIKLDSGAEVRLDKVHIQFEPGQIPDMKADISYRLPNGTLGNGTLSANNPVFIMKTGVYLKDAALSPTPGALLELSHEPGAVWALVGSVLFVIGTFIFCLLKLRESF